MQYDIVLSKLAGEGLERLAKSEPRAYDKAMTLLQQIKSTPYQGLGKPEQLRGNYSGCWSRRITDRHRLVYKVEEERVVVLILKAYGHYDDK